MFRSDKLTGSRGRARARAMTYSPKADLSGAPKHIRDLIRHPEWVKSIHKIDEHWVAVIGQDIVLLNHPDEAAQEVIAFASGDSAWQCKCQKTRDYFASWCRQLAISGRHHADSVTDIPPKMIEVRQKCRPPKESYRKVDNVAIRYGWRARQKKTDEKAPTHRREFVHQTGSPRDAEKPFAYPVKLLDRWVNLRKKILEAAAVAMQCRAKAVRKGKETPYQVRVVHAGSRSHNPPRLEVTHVNSEKDEAGGRGVRVTTVGVNFDPFTWYTRVAKTRPRPPRPGIIPVATFMIADRAIHFGIDATKAAGRTIGQYDDSEGKDAMGVFWSSGREMDLPKEGFYSLCYCEYGLRLAHRIKRRDEGITDRSKIDLDPEESENDEEDY